MVENKEQVSVSDLVNFTKQNDTIEYDNLFSALLGKRFDVSQASEGNSLVITITDRTGLTLERKHVFSIKGELTDDVINDKYFLLMSYYIRAARTSTDAMYHIIESSRNAD